MKRLLRLVVSLVVLCGLVFGTVTLVRLANGDFDGDYQLQGSFPQAGEGLDPGSAVVFRGVQVGRVSTITLADNQARVAVLIQPSFQVPATATATIEPVNLFGAEQVAISTPHGNADAGPYLAPGSSFAHAQSSDELGDLFAAATPLLNAVDDNNLATVLGELSQASQGEGPKIAASISAGRSWPACSIGRSTRRSSPSTPLPSSPRPPRRPPPTSTTSTTRSTPVCLLSTPRRRTTSTSSTR